MKKNITLERWLKLAGLLKEEVYEAEKEEKDLDEDGAIGGAIFQDEFDKEIGVRADDE